MTVIHLIVIIKLHKNENLLSPHSHTHSFSPARALTSSPSNAPFASLAQFFFSFVASSSTPLLHATKLPPVPPSRPRRHSCELSPSALTVGRCSHRVFSPPQLHTAGITCVHSSHCQIAPTVSDFPFPQLHRIVRAKNKRLVFLFI